MDQFSFEFVPFASFFQNEKDKIIKLTLRSTKTTDNKYPLLLKKLAPTKRYLTSFVYKYVSTHFNVFTFKQSARSSVSTNHHSPVMLSELIAISFINSPLPSVSHLNTVNTLPHKFKSMNSSSFLPHHNENDVLCKTR